MNESKINDKLKKIYALAMQGVDGEKEAAQKLLYELMEKYSVSFEELMEEERIDTFEFRYKTDEENKILLQVIVKVMDTAEYISQYLGKNNKPLKYYVVDCTLSEKVEIEFLFDFYKRLFQKEKELLIEAFIQKHALYASHPLSTTRNVPSAEELEAIAKMMNALSDECPRKAITTRKE
ncbi:MAG: hypothetical protein IK093_17725 [Ruminiclostridium sp.]|nr:hypothetical protein [Ruminiclostridium sp.]